MGKVRLGMRLSRLLLTNEVMIKGIWYHGVTNMVIPHVDLWVLLQCEACGAE